MGVMIVADEIKWIKLSTGILDDEKIIAIEDLPDGPSLCWMWIKLLALAGRQNNDGRISLTEEIPYTDTQLAKRFRMPIATVQLGLRIFQQYSMIEIIDDFIYTSNWAKYQSLDGMEKVKEQTRERVQRYRDRKKAAAIESGDTRALPASADPESGERQEETKQTAAERRFERFWKAYPKKVGKGGAEKSFAKYKPDDQLTETMIRAIEAQKKSRQWKEGYIPNPQTWLNQKRWLDEMDEEPLPFTDPPELGYIRDESIEDWN